MDGQSAGQRAIAVKAGRASAVSEQLPVAIHPADFVSPKTIGILIAEGLALGVVRPFVIAALNWALGQRGVGQDQLEIISRNFVHEKISGIVFVSAGSVGSFVWVGGLGSGDGGGGRGGVGGGRCDILVTEYCELTCAHSK